MSRAPLPLVAASVSFALSLFAMVSAHAEAAPSDSLLEGYMRRMTDSTSGYFGVTAQLPDTTGLDSMLTVGLSEPPGVSRRTRRANRLAPTPAIGFNRVDGWQLGGELGTGASRGFGRVNAKLQYTLGQKDFLGGGRYLHRWTDRGRDAAWSFDLWGGRATEAFDRDHHEALLTSVRAIVSGADRQQYLRRDGVRGLLVRETASGRLSLAYRDQLESSRPTSTTWNLLGRELALVPNGPAGFGRAREAAIEGDFQVPKLPLRLQLQHWTAGRATNSGFTYRRTRIALGGDVGLTRHIAVAPQLEWGRLRGEALPQEAFYLGGSSSLRSLERNELHGAGKAFGRVDALLMDDVLQLLRIPHPDMFPLQIGAFLGSGAVWGGEAFSGGPGTRRDFPRADEWLSEAGVSVLYRPGVPDPEIYLRIDYVMPLGPDSGREAGIAVSFQRTLNLLPVRRDQ
ncbi:MAG: hypothetical protein ABIU54_11120 [Candidatus Eisenbacteria bacterium]